MKRHQRQGIGMWLALFAMLMIYVGPLVSQSMPMDHAMSMSAGLDALACSEEQRAPSHHAATHPAEEQQKFSNDHFMEKCGYCGLFSHSPSLAPPALIEPAAPPEIGRSAVIVTSQQVPVSPVFPGARCRAPPFSLA